MEHLTVTTNEFLILFLNKRSYEIKNSNGEYSFIDLIEKQVESIKEEERNDINAHMKLNQVPDFTKLFELVDQSEKSKSLLSDPQLFVKDRNEFMKRFFRNSNTQAMTNKPHLLPFPNSSSDYIDQVERQSKFFSKHENFNTSI